MQPLESLGLSANQWQFLSEPDRYVEASTRLGRKLVLESTRRQFLTARDILAPAQWQLRRKGTSRDSPRRRRGPREDGCRRVGRLGGCSCWG